MSTWKRIEPVPTPAAAPPSQVSAAKLEANRANAAKSTGPRTDEGKARSARNSTKHGLSSRELVIRPEERADFEQLQNDLVDDLRPDGALQDILFAQIVHASWNLRRVRTLEAGLFTGDSDPLADEQNEARLDRLDRYAQRFERTLLRAIKELRRLQTDRIANLSIDACHADTLSPLVDIKAVAVAKRTHYQGNTEKVRATLAQTDLEITAAKGRVPKDLITENVPRAAHG
jgi:hypothetical protein